MNESGTEKDRSELRKDKRTLRLPPGFGFSFSKQMLSIRKHMLYEAG